MKTIKTYTLILTSLIIVLTNISVSSQNINAVENDGIYIELQNSFSKEKITIDQNYIKVIIDSDEIFEPNSSQFKQKKSSDLNKIIQIFKNNRGYKFVMLVHTSAEGAEDLNLLISQKRSNALAKHLAKNGIKKGRFKSVGMGESQSNISSTNRIEFVINTLQ